MRSYLSILLRDRLLVFIHAGEDDIALHDVFDHGRTPRQNQRLERDKSDQAALVVDHVAVVDRFAIGASRAHQLERLAHRDVWRQRHVVGRHRCAGRPRLVAGEPADVFALSLSEEWKDRVDDILVETIDQVGAFVVRHQVEEIGRLFWGHGSDQPDLPRTIEIVQDLGTTARR